MKDFSSAKKKTEDVSRLEMDIDFKKVIMAIIGLAIPLFFLYHYFSESISGALLLTIVMIILGFLFAAVAGYLVYRAAF